MSSVVEVSVDARLVCIVQFVQIISNRFFSTIGCPQPQQEKYSLHFQICKATYSIFTGQVAFTGTDEG